MVACAETFGYYTAKNRSVKKPVIHFTLNPSVQDNLSEGQMASLACEFMERMGYGSQPYIVYLHEDISRRHMHIVSVRVDEQGKELPYAFDLRQAIAHCREMEQRHGLHAPNASDTKAEISNLCRVDYPSGNVKEQIKNTAQTLIGRYRCQSLNELKTLLELYNIRIEEVKGQVNGKEYRGLLYGALNDAGERMGTPIKASRLGKIFG